MKIKLDENLGARGVQILEDGGCDVATVVSQTDDESPGDPRIVSLPLSSLMLLR